MLAVDERGNPFIIIRDQGTKQRITGREALRANILAATATAQILRTSLGPRGLDKILVSQHGEISVTNDGATIMKELHVEHQIGKLLVDLSKSMDAEIGDGTTSVVVLSGALLEAALDLLDRGLHPLRIAEGFDAACDVAIKRLGEIAGSLTFTRDSHEDLDVVCRTTLNSKVVSRFRDALATIAVDAVLRVADLERRDVNLERIKIVTKAGGCLEDTKLLNGLLIDKTWAHSQMRREVSDVRLCILTAPFEPPKPKSKYTVTVSTVEQYHALHQHEQAYFAKQIELLKSAGATAVVSQWGFDDEATSLLASSDLPAVRWVLGGDIEKLAITTGAKVVQRFEDISADKLGGARSMKEVAFGVSCEHMLLIDGLETEPCVTILIRGGNKLMLDEAERSVHDALCVARNLVRDNRIVYGGGAAEIAAAAAVRKEAAGLSQYAFHAFADALESIPQALAANSGYHPIETVEAVKKEQLTTGDAFLGIDCLFTGTRDMKQQRVIETLHGKMEQFRLATQIARMILKIDDVIGEIQL